MLQRLRASMIRFMTGRNGVDQLSWFLLILGVVLNLIGSFARLPILQLLAYIPLVLTLYRTFSRNVPKRYAENQKFTQFFARIKGRKNYCYFKCPSCKTQVKVPKGKVDIRISFPSCKEKFVKKT